MSAIADAIELFMHLLSTNNNNKPACERSSMNAGIGFVYLMFAFYALVIYTKHSDKDFSLTLTASALVQLCGFCVLTLKVRAQKSVAGISSKTLEMYALFFICRLASTTVKNGYIPVDKSGRYMYQACDTVSFLVVMQLLWCCHKTYKWTYQAEEDTMSIFPLIPPCVVLGYFIHADLNRSLLYDTIWAISTNIDTLAMLPQLWMMSKVGGQVDGCTAHFTASLCVSRALSLWFWFTAYEDVTDGGLVSQRQAMQYRRFRDERTDEDGAHLAATIIVIANIIQLLLAADFMFYYCKARFAGTSIRLPQNRLSEPAQEI